MHTHATPLSAVARSPLPTWLSVRRASEQAASVGEIPVPLASNHASAPRKLPGNSWSHFSNHCKRLHATDHRTNGGRLRCLSELAFSVSNGLCRLEPRTTNAAILAALNPASRVPLLYSDIAESLRGGRSSLRETREAGARAWDNTASCATADTRAGARGGTP